MCLETQSITVTAEMVVGYELMLLFTAYTFCSSIAQTVHRHSKLFDFSRMFGKSSFSKLGTFNTKYYLINNGVV